MIVVEDCRTVQRARRVWVVIGIACACINPLLTLRVALGCRTWWGIRGMRLRAPELESEPPEGR